MDFDEILEAVNGLEPAEQNRLFEILQNNDYEATLRRLLSELENNCPECGSEKRVKYGRRSGRQRYQCKECERLYTEFTDTPLEGVRTSLSKFGQLIGLMKQQASIREIANELNISTKTAFKWRKKTMRFFAKLHEDQQLTGIVEADETYLLHSRKGDKGLDREPRERGGESNYPGLSRDQDCILTLKDRSGNIFIKLVGQARPSFDDIEVPIREQVCRDAVLCTDGMKAYGKFARKYGIERKNIKESDERSYHIQGINALHSKIKDWLKGFNGIASKYIDDYLGYYAYQQAMT